MPYVFQPRISSISLLSDESSHFLFPVPMDRSSKLLNVLSRPLLVAVARVKEDDCDSNPGWIFWVVDRRLLLETIRLDRFSLGSPEELGRLLDITALFEELPFLDDERGLDESGSTSLDDGRSSDDLSREESPCRACPEPFRRANASTAPENLSRISCPTEGRSTRSADEPGIIAALPLGRDLELEPICGYFSIVQS